LRAEIIPFEPDAGNADVGSGKIKTYIGAISYEGKRVWLLYFNVCVLELKNQIIQAQRIFSIMSIRCVRGKVFEKILDSLFMT